MIKVTQNNCEPISNKHSTQRLKTAILQYDNYKGKPTLHSVIQELKKFEISLSQTLIVNQKLLRVMYLEPPHGMIDQQTSVQLLPADLQSQRNLQSVQFLNLSQEKKNKLSKLPQDVYLTQDQLVDIDGTLFQVIMCKPTEGIFNHNTEYKIFNTEKPMIKELSIFTGSNLGKDDILHNFIKPYFLFPRFVWEGQKIIIKESEFFIKHAKPKRGFVDIAMCQFNIIDIEQLSLKSMNDDDEDSQGLQNQVNTLNVLQDKTASRNQFVNKRKKLYQMMEGYAQYDEKENQIVFSSHELNSVSSINEFPNFPNTFLSKIHREIDEELSDLESDLLDSDETNQGVAALQQQNARLNQMTLPVFFKNILASGRTNGAQRQTILQQPEQPLPSELSFESSDSDVDMAMYLSDSSILHEDQPHLTSLPRQFNEIIMFNSHRRLPVNSPGVANDIILQLPERIINMDWIRSKGTTLNIDFCKCMICLMEYKDDEYIRTMPCLHYFHRECIDFWLVKSKKCPICKTGCDQIINY